MEAARRYGQRYSVYRHIPIERRHWVASMQGIRLVPKCGWAYVHSDGSITMLQTGMEINCRCGRIHTCD